MQLGSWLMVISLVLTQPTHLNPRWRTKTEVFVVVEAVAEGKEASENGLQG